MAFLLDPRELKDGLIIFRRGDVRHRKWCCRIKLPSAAYRDAAKAAFKGEAAPTPWEAQMLERQARVRGLYLAHAILLGRSVDPADQALGAKVEAFVRAMPQPDGQRQPRPDPAVARRREGARPMIPTAQGPAIASPLPGYTKSCIEGISDD